MLRYVALLLLILLLALEVKLWTGEWGMREVWRLRAARRRAESRKTRSSSSATRRLSAEVQDLKNGKEAIEERARSELGLIKPGETFYQVVEPPSADAKKDADDRPLSPLLWCVVPAAGRSTRFGGAVPKQYLPLAGKPLLLHTLERLAAHPRIAGLMVALAADDRYWPGISALSGKPVLTTIGGDERADSVLAGLLALRDKVRRR